MSQFEFKETSLSGLVMLERKPSGDTRGYLERLYCQTELKPFLNSETIRQINHTRTNKRGTVRGMHFQYPPYTETKLVSCIYGEVLDVAVDLRKGSPTFLQYHSEILNPGNHKTLLIPQGFAHGFQTLVEGCEMLYFHTADYHAESEGGLNALDSTLAIHWPLPISERSTRDETHSMLDSEFNGIDLS